MADSMIMFVVLLRGINVGRNHRLAMADLRAIIEELGGGTVRTHLQSGNAVCTQPVDGAAVADGVSARFGFRPETIVMTAEEFRDTVAACPFDLQPDIEMGGKAVHVFFAGGPLVFDSAAAAQTAAPSERVAATERAVYLLAPDGIHGSKLARQLERFADAPLTGRNGNTVAKLLDMVA